MYPPAPFPLSPQHSALSTDVAVIGGGLGGVAAALAAAEAGARVLLTEETDWLGGQLTSQGVAALDEHPHIERFGGTRAYYRLREGIRARYRERYGVPATSTDGAPLNPGNGWVSRLCCEPRVALATIAGLLAPHVASGRLTILREHAPVGATVEDDRVVAVRLRARDGAGEVEVRAAYFLDATELGDLLPLTGAAYVTGAEARAETGEPHASPDGARPGEVQGFTFPFAVEHRPGEDHTILRPAGYERFRDEQPYSLWLADHDGRPVQFLMFGVSPDGKPPFWTYRRLFDAALLDSGGRSRDIAMINWAGNDYSREGVIDRPPAERARALDEARRLSLGFLHWLQTEVPRDDGGGRGYPGLRLLPEVMGTADGLAKAPYIRESRRLLACTRIVEQEVAAAGRAGARAAPFADAVGVGSYHLDLHPCVGNPRSLFAPTLPFQIPLGALIPRRTVNLLAACKNIGTTHLTNGCYRLHPVEWNIGEAAGALAAHCRATGRAPRAVWAASDALRRFQRLLLARGVPLAWTVDLPADHELFAPAQLLVTHGALPAGSARAGRLDLRLGEPLSGAEAAGLCAAAARLCGRAPDPDQLARWLARPAVAAGRAAVAAALAPVTGADGPAPPSDPPTWGEVCAALAPAILAATVP